MTTTGWLFEQKQEMGGASADAYRNTLSGQGIPKADLFVREAIQNSVDAALDKAGMVRIRIYERVLEGSDLTDFLGALSFRSGGGPGERRMLLSTDDEDRDIDALIGDQLRVLYVEDHGTKGLTGKERLGKPNPDDRFRNLCLELGSTAPPEPDRGGTYGFGKSVYWVSSSLWSVALYSRFTPANEGVNARLMGVSWFRGHTHPLESDEESDQYTGRAWYGDLTGSKARPLQNERADTAAQSLGFSVREESDTGLSIAILGCDLDLDGLLEGVERWWWPRILSGRLSVEITDRHGSTRSPDPRNNDSLGRYVRAWDLLNSQVEGSGNDSVSELKYKKTPLGSYAITSDGSDDERAYPETSDRVLNAMVRSPGMVVHYSEGPHRGVGHPMCAGLFVSDQDLDPELARSEPPAHNRWDYDSTRQERPLAEEARKRISNLYEKVRERGRVFLREHREKPPEPPDRCEELEKFLGRFLSFQDGNPPPPPPPPDPFSIRFLEGPQRVFVAGGTHLEAKIGLSISEESELHRLRVEIQASAVTILDRGRAGERLPMESMTVEGGLHWQEAPHDTPKSTIAQLELTGGKQSIVHIRSAALPYSEYRADLEFTVGEIDDAE